MSKAVLIRLVFGLVVMMAFGTAGVNAQTATGGGVAAAIEVKAVDPLAGRVFIDTGDSPIGIERQVAGQGGNVVTRTPLTDENRIKYQLVNRSGSDIQAYSMDFSTGREPSVRMALYHGAMVRPGHPMDSYLLSDTDTPRWRFDWVLFADGTTWGPDEHGRSAEILGFIKGTAIAREKAVEFAGPDAEKMFTSLRSRGFRSWSMYLPLREVTAFDAEWTYFKAGYDSVISMLGHEVERNKNGAGRVIIERLKQFGENPSK